MNTVLASSNFLNNFSAIVLIVIAEFDCVKTSDLDITGKRLGILRNFRFLSSF